MLSEIPQRENDCSRSHLHRISKLIRKDQIGGCNPGVEKEEGLNEGDQKTQLPVIRQISPEELVLGKK